MCDCENCKYCHTFEAFYDEWKGMQYDSECTASYDEMSRECAVELGLEDEWTDCHMEQEERNAD